MMERITFDQQAKVWLNGLAVRRRKPIAPASLAAFGSYVRKLLPMVGSDTKLEDIGNGFVKDVVTQLVTEKLSAKTIQELVATIKQIVKSAVDRDGNLLFPRTWNNSFIDLPAIEKQRQPCLTSVEVEKCILEAKSQQEAVFYAVLAGTGLRVSEALSIRICGADDQTHWDPSAAVIRVRSTIFRGKELSRTKTLAARREVDLDPSLNALLEQFVAAERVQPGDFLFQSRSGRAMHLQTARARLARHDCAKGFHGFRRFRITRLREQGTPEDILRFWCGHEGKNLTDRYSKLAESVARRKEWAVRSGLGFLLPVISSVTGYPAPTTAHRRKRTTTHTPSEPVACTEPASAPYIAEDSDLPELFFEPGEHSL